MISGLRSEGVKAIAAPLPLTTLADDAAALDRLLERVEGPVVLAANAYAGAVVQSVSSDQVASLVYVSAPAPDEGETVGDVFCWAESHSPGPGAESRFARADLASRGGVQPGLRPARDRA